MGQEKRTILFRANCRSAAGPKGSLKGWPEIDDKPEKAKQKHHGWLAFFRAGPVGSGATNELWLVFLGRASEAFLEQGYRALK